MSGNWYSSSPEYSGSTTVTYGDVIVEGPGSIVYEERMDSAIEVNFKQDHTCDSDSPADLLRSVRVGVPVGPTRLTLESAEGTLEAVGQISGPPQPDFWGDEYTDWYRPLRADFIAKQQQSARFYVLPLTNYIAQFADYWPEGDSHPLRLRQQSDCGMQNGWVTHFKYNGKPGYIQPLHDHKARVESLEAFRATCVVTALLIGELPTEAADAVDPLDLLPIDYLWLLSLATGVDVGAPWVELRSGDGGLVRRIHVDLRSDPFRGQHFQLIKDRTHRGTGHFLTQAPLSSYWNSPQLRAVMTYIVRSMATGNIEDRYLDLARSLEGLSNLLELRPSTLLDALPSPDREEAKAALLDTVRALQSLAKRNLEAGQEPAHRILQQIASRVANAGNQSSTFGELVVAVCQHFGFLDAQIVEQRFALSPHPISRTWMGLLSVYRNRAAHGYYFDLKATDDEVSRIVKVSNHLLDITARAVFTLFGYTGTYQPAVLVDAVDGKLEWVTANTNPEIFGYL